MRIPHLDRRPLAARRLSHLVTSVLFFAALVASPTLAASEDEDSERGAAWMPSFSLSWGAHSQSIDGQTGTTESALSPANGDSLISTMFQFEGRLHTPLELDVPTKPRLFLTAGVQLPLAKELIAQRFDESFNRGQPNFDQNCPTTLPPGGAINETCALEIRNRTTIDVMWYAGLGIDLTLPVLDSQFHISPAVEYFGLSAHSVGDFQRTSAAAGIDEFVEVANIVGDSEIYHGISQSLMISVDVYEDGPWRWSMFIQERVAWLLTDPYTAASTRLGTNRITFVSDLDELIVQGVGGIQLQWTGK